jgi:hypothetical protein
MLSCDHQLSLVAVAGRFRQSQFVRYKYVIRVL